MLRAPLVVGYKGEIGRFILACLLEDMPKANDIFCVDVSNSREDVLERIERADYVFLCVPLQNTLEWLIEYAEALNGKIIVEQASLKTAIYEHPGLSELQFLSMHLLFRPSATPEAERRCLVFSDGLPPEQVQEFRDYVQQAFKTPTEILQGKGEPTHLLHDRLMARDQALVHRVIRCLAGLLDDQATRTFVGQRVCDLAERIRGGDPVLYQMIQENPFLEAEVDQFMKRLGAM